jgi:hypothetical protein
MPKLIVMDWDETAGSFAQIGLFWDAWQRYQSPLPSILTQLLDLVPEIWRPHWWFLLRWFVVLKQQGRILGVLVYTNNQAPVSWTPSLVQYVETRLQASLFLPTIGAFSIRGDPFESCRTTPAKTFSDLIRCTRLPPLTPVAFIDDESHEGMDHPRVFYIHVRKYVRHFSWTELLDRVWLPLGGHGSRVQFLNVLLATGFVVRPHQMEEQSRAIHVSHELRDHLEAFLQQPDPSRRTGSRRRSRTRTPRPRLHASRAFTRKRAR